MNLWKDAREYYKSIYSLFFTRFFGFKLLKIGSINLIKHTNVIIK